MFVVQDNFTDLLKKSSSNSPIEALHLVGWTEKVRGYSLC